MTASRLKSLHEYHNPNTHFFDRKTMRFFGDTMNNFGVYDAGTIKQMTDNGIEDVEVWELHRKRPVKGGLHGHCAYFRKDNGKQVFNHE